MKLKNYKERGSNTPSLGFLIMWIAKNSITGTTYGSKFDSIYDCQDFINTKLCVLEYEMQKCFALEFKIQKELNSKAKSFIDLIQESFQYFIKESGIEEKTSIIADALFKKQTQKEIDKRLQDYANSIWQKNNIIRCYNVSQKRFADGFDF